MHLPPRLLALANFVTVGAVVADIGTDHAYLPIYLIQENIARRVIAGEVNPGPFQAAQSNIQRFHCEAQVSVRFGSGFAVLSPDEAEIAVIAGMGGDTIIEILQEFPPVTGSLHQLVLQPMVAAALVRRWLVANDWTIVDEALVEDDGRIYEIIAAEPGQSPGLSLADIEIGPVLLQKKPVLLKKHILERLGKYRKILAQMSESERARISPKFQMAADKVRMMEELVQWL